VRCRDTAVTGLYATTGISAACGFTGAKFD
jgi:hypothetical protein